MAKLKNETVFAAGAAAGEQSIEVLRKRFDALNEKRIAAETNRRSAEEQLEKLRRKARDEYQTDDLSELQMKLREMIANNERLRADYQKHLDGVEAQLAAVEQNHKTAQGTTGEARRT
jgi:hypothetical protein